MGGAASSCTDWSVLREEPGEELSSSSVYNLSIVNTGASEIIHDCILYVYGKHFLKIVQE